MAIELLHTLEIIEVLENYIERVRPPESMRHQMDISYKIENQSVIIYELRPVWNNPKEMQESNVANATFLKSKNRWKVFWIRADSKWHGYKHVPTVSTIQDFVELVEEDKYACFWG
jgi:spore coat polysaccharide biosynthesis protein SpsF (cytidylyltransferase family)